MGVPDHLKEAHGLWVAIDREASIENLVPTVL
jgi:hypothetical protein